MTVSPVRADDVPVEVQPSVACVPSGIEGGTTTYSGTIVQNWSTTPVVDATVEVFPLVQGVDGKSCATTNGSGAFSIEVPTAWTNAGLMITPPDSVDLEGFGGTLPDPGDSTFHVSLGSFDCPSGSGIVVGATVTTATVSGAITNEAGSPVEGASVTGISHPNGLVCALTSDLGEYQLTLPTAWVGPLLISVDPPASATTLGSSGRYANFGGTPLSAQNVVLTAFEFSATITATQNNQAVPVGDFMADVCLFAGDNEQDSPLICGRSRLEGGQMVVKIDYDGIVDDQGETVVPTYYDAYGRGAAGWAVTERLPIPVDATAITVELSFQNSGDQPNDGDQPNGGGQASGNGCAQGEAPNLTGKVMSAGTAYETTVELRGTRNDPQEGVWASDGLQLKATTDADGDFAFCFDFANNPDIVGLQAIAAPVSNTPLLGSSASEVADPSTCSAQSPCSLDVAMQTATLKGTITGAEEIEIYALSMTEGRKTLARVTPDDNGNYSLAFPFADQSSFFLRGERYSSEQVPFVAFRTYSGDLIVIDGATLTPNVLIDVLKPDGSSFGSEGEWLNPFLITEATDGVCPPNTIPMQGPLSGNCSATIGQRSPGSFYSLLTDGQWAVSVDGSGYVQTIAYLLVSGGGATITPVSPLTPGDNGRFTLTLSSGAIKFAVEDAAGTAVSNVEMQIEKFDDELGWFNWQPIQAASIGGGKFGWSPINNGSYKIRMIPGDQESGVAETEVFLQVLGAPSSAVVSKSCTYSQSGMGSSPVCDGDPPLKNAAGEHRLAMLPSNFTMQICAPDITDNGIDDCPSPSSNFYSADIEIIELVDMGYGYNELYLQRVQVASESTSVAVRLNPPAAGSRIFKLRVQPPWGNPNLWASIDVVVSVAAGGVISQCTAGETGVCHSQTPLNETNDVYSLGVALRFAQAKIIGVVSKPESCQSNCSIAQSWVGVQKIIQDEYGVRNEWMGGTNTNSTGKFGLSLAEGTYQVTAEPPYGVDLGLTSGMITIEVNPDGLVTTVDGAAHLSGDITVRLREPNVVGVVKAGDNPRPFANVNVEKWNGSFWEWQPIWGNANRTGQFTLSLGDGKWKMTAWPQGSDSGVYTEGRLEVEVDGGTVTRVGACVTDPQAACGVVQSPLTLQYGTPNASGTIRRSTENGLVEVSWAGVGILKWDPDAYFFQWNNWTNAGQNGRFAVQLDDGLYELAVEPPAGITGAVRTVRTVKVAAGTACFVASVSDQTCLGGGALDITLDGPNVTGVVRGNGAVKAAWVTAEKWNPASNWFEWQNQWADARQGSGSFGFVLSDGYHKISAEPRAGSGFAKGTVYVRVVGQQWCVTGLDQTGSPVECAPATQANPLTVALPGSNLVGAVRYDHDGSGDTALIGLSDGWVEVFSNNGNFLQWESSTGLNFDGSFSVRLEGQAASAYTEYRVVITPASWNNPRNLGKKRLSYWVGDFDSDGAKDDLCPQIPTGDTTCGVALVTETQTFVMGGGNVVGNVFQPNGTTVVANSEISVEKKVTELWGTYWQWTDNWTRSNDTGNFSLSLDAGTYKITARPQWGSAAFSANSMEIQVLGNDTWCLLANFNSVGSTCSTQETSLSILLKSPNITAQVVRPGGTTGVRDAWVYIEQYKEFDPDGDGVQPAWTWWEWTDNNANSTASGQISMNVSENGRYRITVSPPWNDSAGDLARFSTEFVVSDGGSSVDWDLVTADVQPLTNGKLEFPAPNVTFVLKESAAADAATVRDAWVYVERLVSFDPDGDGGQPAWTWWEWADVSGNSVKGGKVSLNVPSTGSNETYRLVINAPWNKSDLPRFTHQFTVSNGGQVTGVPSGLSFPAANVSGIGRINTTDANSFGYIDVRNSVDQSIGGISLSSTGGFSTSLADGDYTLRMFPNYGLSSLLPIDLKITVDGDVLASWRYGSDAVETNRCPVSGLCTIDARLDFVPPNVEILVTGTGDELGGSGGAKAGAFVRLTNGATGEVYDFVTGSDGKFKAKVPAGTYDISVVHLEGASTLVGSTSNLAIPENADPLSTTTVTVAVP